MTGSQQLAWFLVVLAVLVVYVPTLGMSFLGDDYVFLDKTRLAGFADLWSRGNTDFGWYRPWSREFYFWTIQHVAGPEPVAFRLANLVLWIASLLLFGALVRRLSSERAAIVTVAGVASLGLWGAPLMWISGSQDLWLFFFLSLALLCLAQGRDRLALLPYAGALLSKETAAVYPLLAAGLWRFAQRRNLRDVAIRLVPSAALTLVWFFLHPVLAQRLFHGKAVVPGVEQPLPAWQVVAKTALAMVNADQLGDALMPTARSVITVSIAAVMLAIAMWLAAEDTPEGALPDRTRGLLLFGGCWAFAGWLPLFLPSISWHAYYGCIGAVGAWVVLGAWLQHRRRLLVALTLVVGLLRAFNTSSRAWDWGSEWYQRRAGSILGAIQEQLMSRYPTLPSHTRVFFGNIPNNIGLVAGSSPAIRVWYRDNTLQAGFYSYYRPRTAGEPPGQDLFFHFDSTQGLQEVRLGHEDVARAAQLESGWEKNHEAVAITLLSRGDLARAAGEFEKLAQLRTRPDALMFAAICRESAGDSASARVLMRAAAVRTGLSPDEIADWAQRLRTSMPRAAQ